MMDATWMRSQNLIIDGFSIPLFYWISSSPPINGLSILKRCWTVKAKPAVPMVWWSHIPILYLLHLIIWCWCVSSHSTQSSIKASPIGVCTCVRKDSLKENEMWICIVIRKVVRFHINCHCAMLYLNAQHTFSCTTRWPSPDHLTDSITLRERSVQ